MSAFGVTLDEFLQAVKEEVLRAQVKYPKPNKNFAALVEEVGEVAKAFLEDEPVGAVISEAVQVAAMAGRIALEGDPTLHKGWATVDEGEDCLSCVRCNDVVKDGEEVHKNYEIVGKWGEPVCLECLEKEAESCKTSS